MRRVNKWNTRRGFSGVLEKLKQSFLFKLVKLWSCLNPVVTDTKSSEQIRHTADNFAARMQYTVLYYVRRRLLINVVHSVLLNRSEVWTDVLSKEMYGTYLAQVQWRGALGVSPVYCSVSVPATMYWWAKVYMPQKRWGKQGTCRMWRESPHSQCMSAVGRRNEG